MYTTECNIISVRFDSAFSVKCHLTLHNIVKTFSLSILNRIKNVTTKQYYELGFF